MATFSELEAVRALVQGGVMSMPIALNYNDDMFTHKHSLTLCVWFVCCCAFCFSLHEGHKALDDLGHRVQHLALQPPALLKQILAQELPDYLQVSCAQALLLAGYDPVLGLIGS
jgi:hypothetical protein